jgi:polyhydroxyalkanoate synthesis regulator phasin
MNTQNTLSEAVKTIELMSVSADQLAAVIDSMIEDGEINRRGLEIVRDSLGEIHVELDQAAEDVRQELREPVFVRLVGVAA